MGRSRSRSRSRGRDRRDDSFRGGGGGKDYHHHRSRGGGSGGGLDRRDSRSRDRERDRDRDRDRRHHHHHHKRRHQERDDSRERRKREKEHPARHDDEKAKPSKDRQEEGKRRSSKEEKRSSRSSFDDGEGKEKREKEEEEELALDEASLLLMVGGVDEAEEERLIAERKRKREEIEAMHRKKQEEEEQGLEKMIVVGQVPGDAEEWLQARKRLKEGGNGAALPPNEAESFPSRKGEEAGISRSQQAPEQVEDEEEDEVQDAIEVTVHNKPLSEEEEDRNEAQIESAEDNGIMLDMFALSPGKAMGKLKPNAMLSSAAAKGVQDAADNLEDNWDDHEGYYKTLVGELIVDRYLVLGSIGRGVFSTVLKCQDKRNDDVPVAIKLIRNNEVMRKAAQKELDLLREISAADPDNKKHCVRLLDYLEHRNHAALVFESMQMNLRETLRKFGKHVGINITAVRTYAKQLLVALKHIGNLSIVHADIKPDNILVSEGFSQLKICDFGSAFKENAPDNDPTPYLVSRFYRAPEIILGFDYNRAVDLWSIGCCLYELFTGRVTFPGMNNNEMLRLMMEIKGGLPAKMVRRHRAAYEKLQLEPLFEADGRYRSQEPDLVSKKPTLRLLHIPNHPTRDLQAILMKAKAASDDKTLVTHLADLLEKIFMLDPLKRISVKDALHHPFVSSSAALASSTK